MAIMKKRRLKAPKCDMLKIPKIPRRDILKISKYATLGVRPPLIPSAVCCATCSRIQRDSGVNAAAQQRIVGVQVKKNTADRYAYLHQEDKELDNAILTMKKILKESDLRPNN